jgi:hypothetical protein
MMKCSRCDENARWLRCTQFAGDHPFCDLHALMEEGFGTNDSYEYWTEVKEMENKLYLVEVMSTFRMRYVVEAREEEHALDEVVMNEHNTDFKEFSQEHIGTHIFSSRELSAKDFTEMFDKDNDYLAEWPIAKKMNCINTIDYKDEE